MQSRISVSLAPREKCSGDPGEGPPLFLVRTEDRRVEKRFFGNRPPPPSLLDPALEWRENCDRLPRNLPVTELREVVT